jgi:hypothetical protein
VNSPVTLPCLSLRQPWAWLVLHGGKNIENRKWNTRHRGTFLIHAAKGMTIDEWHDAFHFAEQALPPDRWAALDMPCQPERGGIVGAARLVRVHEPGASGSAWQMAGQFGFELESITPLPFRAYRGALGFFRVQVTTDEARVLREAGLL